MKSILVTGCNRGIGLGLIQYVTENCNMNHIFATCRNVEKAQTLMEIADKCENVHVLTADMKEESHIKKLADTVTSELNGQGLDVLINSAGISTKFTRLKLVKEADLREHFCVNTIAPILLTKALLPLLKKGHNEGGSNGIVVNMSSILSSMQENTTGGYYPYRTSKAALNAATKSMSIDLKGDNITVVSLHPGWVKTDMGGLQAPLTVETAVVDIVNFIRNITPEYSGSLYSHEGNRIPW